MESMDISHLANVLRPVLKSISSGKGKLCLSSNYLSKLCDVIETCPSMGSFNAKNNARDLQFLVELVENTINLRIIPDVDNNNSENCLNIERFKNIKVLEIHKLNIDNVIGIQKLRSQVQELSCCKSLKSVSDIIEKCGGDDSQPFNWNELRVANFSHNSFVEVDNSFEYTLSLHTLNLSHNDLKELNISHLLPNLKQLNLSYNKLAVVPSFKGQINKRLQVLILNNNFIEDLVGLTTLSNISQLDLASNCLLNHESLLPISHLASLQWLNLHGNPLTFHPQHRNLASSYLNKNISTVKFSLNGVLLDKTEKNLTGSFHPVVLRASSSSSTSLDSSSGSLQQERPRRVRNVVIEDESVVKEAVEEVCVAKVSSTRHLEIKRQLEQLREEHGDSWLYKHSGLMVQNVLGFQTTTTGGGVTSSTPHETVIDSLYAVEARVDSTAEKHQEISAGDEDDTNCPLDDDASSSDLSDGEDVYMGGEECLFLAVNKANGMEVFVVVTEAHISERDCTTSKERSRWHINTVMSCEKCAGSNDVRINFDTLRRDRKQRVYGLEASDVDVFFDKLQERSSAYPRKKDEVSFQCMKCAEDFKLERYRLSKENNLTCPKCDSNLVVANNM